MTGSREGFYVGYLPVPVGLLRWLRVMVPVAMWAACAAVAGWAWTQPDPGGGVWETGRAEAFSGVVVERPYPMLVLDEGEGGRAPAGVLLLVEQGKRGAQERVRGLEGRAARASGWVLRRDGRAVLELEPGTAGLAVAGEDGRGAAGAGIGAALAWPEDGERVVLRGEIVDSKCYLGAMKPGEGKTHKACATLCVRGGIPAMLVTRGSGGGARYRLLVGADGGALGDWAHGLIGEPVEVSGTRVSWRGLEVVRVEDGGVRRR